MASRASNIGYGCVADGAGLTYGVGAAINIYTPGVRLQNATFVALAAMVANSAGISSVISVVATTLTGTPPYSVELDRVSVDCGATSGITANWGFYNSGNAGIVFRDCSATRWDAGSTGSTSYKLAGGFYGAGKALKLGCSANQWSTGDAKVHAVRNGCGIYVGNSPGGAVSADSECASCNLGFGQYPIYIEQGCHHLRFTACHPYNGFPILSSKGNSTSGSAVISVEAALAAQISADIAVSITPIKVTSSTVGLVPSGTTVSSVTISPPTVTLNHSLSSTVTGTFFRFIPPANVNPILVHNGGYAVTWDGGYLDNGSVFIDVNAANYLTPDDAPTASMVLTGDIHLYGDGRATIQSFIILSANGLPATDPSGTAANVTMANLDNLKLSSARFYLNGTSTPILGFQTLNGGDWNPVKVNQAALSAITDDMVITRAGLNVAGGVNVVTGPLSLVTTAQVVSSGASPSISAESGLGTGPTVSISGSDLAGTITVTPGSGPTVGNIVYIGFNGARAAAPAAVVLGPRSCGRIATN